MLDQETVDEMKKILTGVMVETRRGSYFLFTSMQLVKRYVNLSTIKEFVTHPYGKDPNSVEVHFKDGTSFVIHPNYLKEVVEFFGIAVTGINKIGDKKKFAENV